MRPPCVPQMSADGQLFHHIVCQYCKHVLFFAYRLDSHARRLAQELTEASSNFCAMVLESPSASGRSGRAKHTGERLRRERR
mmetsp:Transcript_43760/g.123768  ORF Transcript_43760/g.123768 Transcript_43760/m.123768 type:complete len:82 (+) Transcript_43760:28-273(+)